MVGPAGTWGGDEGAGDGEGASAADGEAEAEMGEGECDGEWDGEWDGDCCGAGEGERECQDGAADSGARAGAGTSEALRAMDSSRTDGDGLRLGASDTTENASSSAVGSKSSASSSRGASGVGRRSGGESNADGGPASASRLPGVVALAGVAAFAAPPEVLRLPILNFLPLSFIRSAMDNKGCDGSSTASSSLLGWASGWTSGWDFRGRPRLLGAVDPASPAWAVGAVLIASPSSSKPSSCWAS